MERATCAQHLRHPGWVKSSWSSCSLQGKGATRAACPSERVVSGTTPTNKADNMGSKNERSNKGMKLTSLEHIGRSQLIWKDP